MMIVVYDLRDPDAWQAARHRAVLEELIARHQAEAERYREQSKGHEMATDPVEIINRRNVEVEKIRAYPDLTEEAKERRIAEVSERAQAEYAEAREAAEQEIRERAEMAEKALFETPYPKHTDDVEKAQIRALRRGAYDGVYHSLYFLEPEEAREELDRLLTRAERTGDVELADAVYHVATERGERSVADAYLQRRPNQKRRWEEFVAASQEAAQSRGIEGIVAHNLTERALSSEAS